MFQWCVAVDHRAGRLPHQRMSSEQVHRYEPTGKTERCSTETMNREDDNAAKGNAVDRIHFDSVTDW